jgi:hypothetical protein
VDRCYATSSNQHRKVIEIRDGRVVYTARGGNVKSKWYLATGSTNPPSLETFARAVEKEIPCDDCG